MACQIESLRAKDVLDRYAQCWDSKARSSSGKPTTSDEIRKYYISRGRKQFWRDCPRRELTHKARSRGLLLGYVDLAGGRFSAVGIRCPDGMYIRPDMQVMKSFLDDLIVEFRENVADPIESHFELTDKGRRFLGLMRSDIGKKSV